MSILDLGHATDNHESVDTSHCIREGGERERM